ncbi:hypothetical protein [Vibrio parahaemolyticus]|uniref:hypothetical protein n=2 Tax=Vibrio parahaemolyticus TaxID=670 RepID=UPI0011AB83BB|nr:hypothetical protein [Vibrio parahaemolyticus]EJG1555236.1 hypothetical protein [Vibrio parahaemolyticus]EJG1979662.1 hypothetical protein [Vibrio parahaemolyticus]EJG2057911.1 hypothetical protein [Vibrio parahaemolyticus]EJG2217058.1 hypothetical protein [Vibrio parahaemolyticus]EMA2462065.1 hypothetical protein [Vibrio parahaemolyticus]
MMELKEFIATTLGEIQEGVQIAINETIKNGVNGAINPSWGGKKGMNNTLIKEVHFDIAVTASDEEKSGIKGGIKVVGISIGGDDTASTTTSRVSRIQFSIPVIPPVTTIS